jgi:hypothetical protein
MPESKTERPIALGTPPTEPASSPVTATEIVAVMLSLLWLGVVVAYFTFVEREDILGVDGGTGLLVKLFIVFLPIALIWVAAVTSRTVRTLRDEARRLQVSVDAMRHSYLQQQHAAAAAVVSAPNVERKLDEIAASAKQTESALAMFSTRRDPGARPVAPGPAPPPSTQTADQPALALDTPSDPMREPLSIEEFIRALNFPDSPEDKEGFRCLRLALEDREASRLIRAAQDVLTLLSQDGIFVDDLRPDRARPEVWRRFAGGERGRAVAALGGIRDRSAIALTAGRMRSDPVFRDAAHHFLRQFDRGLVAFEKTASDTDIAELADTRTARAFMLFGRVTGVFD